MRVVRFTAALVAMGITISPGISFSPGAKQVIPTKGEASAGGTSLQATASKSVKSGTAFDVLSQADPTVEVPLPPSYTKCPFNGIFAGPNSFYRQASKALNGPTIFSFLHRDQPMVEVRGGKAIREVLRQEFTSLSSNAVAGISQKICGTQSIRTTQDQEQHRMLRQLIGVPLSPNAVEKSIPRLEAIGRTRIEEQLSSGREIIAWDMAQTMALDVVWQQILGLDLETPEDIAIFHRKTHAWLKGMWYKEGSPELEATMQSKQYLNDAIDRKINQLLEVGESDGSTVGGLVFATMDDVDDSNGMPSDRTLSRQEVIDNCLVIILAGTETTATNMANTLLLMGLHPKSWDAVIEEQNAIVAQHGETLTPDALKACSYLDAVIHEVMRILPIILVSRRVTRETIVVDGKQIPKGWAVGYNLPLTHQADSSLEQGNMDLLKGFRPERFINADARPGKDYLPFGAGPRQCPGNVLALTEMKSFLALVAREMPSFELVDIDYDPDHPMDEQIEWNELSSLMTPKDGVRIRPLA